MKSLSLCLFLLTLTFAIRIPEIPENFEADYKMTQPFPNSGKYYRSFTNLIERFDISFFGQTSTTINYYRCGFEFQFPGCQRQALTNEMFPLQLPPWAEFRGNVMISGNDCEHWHFGVPFLNAEFDIYITTNANGDIVPVRQRFVLKEMFTFTFDVEYSNVVLGDIDESLLLLPDCPQAPDSIDSCNNALFPAIRENRFVFLLDISGSMNEIVAWQGQRLPRMTVLKAEFERAANFLREDQDFNVFVFSSTSSGLWNKNRPANTTNIEEAIKFVNTLTASGGTALLNALRPLMQDGLEAIYLLSDGMPNSAPATIIDFVRDRNAEMSNPIKIHTTAFASGEAASNFMRDLADLTGGIFTDINDNNQ